jgi:nucleotide sugar dehydrogenase
MKIGIIGLGHVGRAMQGLFARFADLTSYDLQIHSTYPQDDLAKCEFSVVCVDTPMREDGSCNVDNVRAAVTQLPTPRVLLKSTVPPGFTDALTAETGKEICYSPEYFGESNYWSTFVAAGPAGLPFVILGGRPEHRRPMLDDLSTMLGPEKVYFQCTSVEAELIKYMENSYLAAKVTFVNQFFELCETFNADWHTVREGWLLDPRIERSHSEVFRGERGFGGRCLPKDVNAIVAAAENVGYDPHFLRSVLKANSRFRGDLD